MIVNMFHVQVPAERAAAFEGSWSQRAGMVDHMPGFQGMEVLRDGQQAGHYLVVTHWDTKEDFERWASSPEFTAGHARTGGPGGPTGGALEFFEVIPSNPPVREG